MFDRIKWYCDKCGYCIWSFDTELPCPICSNKMTLLNFINGNILANLGGEARYNYLQNKIMHKKFDPLLVQRREKYYKEKRIQYEEQHRREVNANFYEHYDQYKAITAALGKGVPPKEAFKGGCEGKTDFPHCPTCGSYNVERISTGKKMVGAAAFGVLSSDVRNTMHCKNCGYKW